MQNLHDIVRRFQIEGDIVSCTPMGNGNINDTFLVKTLLDGKSCGYTLQSVNTYVFPNPRAVMDNISLVTDFLREKIAREGGNPARETLSIIRTRDGKSYLTDDNGKVWRIYNFIDRSVTFDTIDDPRILENAGQIYGRFQKRLGGLPIGRLSITIENFHNYRVAYQNLENAVLGDAAGRAKTCREEIEFLTGHRSTMLDFAALLESGKIRRRIVHNDTKFNNVLLDERTMEGLCVIDLDTVMPGFSCNDFADAVRYAANPAGESETDLSRVFFHLGLFESFCRGFLPEVKDDLDPAELSSMHPATLVITLELAARFLTDYLNGDVYFKIKHPRHNLERARCQIRLAQDIQEKLRDMQDIVEKYIA